MASSIKLKKPPISKISVAVSFGVFVLCLTAIGLAGYFVWNVLQQEAMPDEETASTKVEVESVNNKMLADIEEHLADKVVRSIPAIDTIRNPFLEAVLPTPPPTPEPIMETMPAAPENLPTEPTEPIPVP